MRKIAFMLIFVMAFSLCLAACGGGDDTVEYMNKDGEMVETQTGDVIDLEMGILHGAPLNQDDAYVPSLGANDAINASDSVYHIYGDEFKPCDRSEIPAIDQIESYAIGFNMALGNRDYRTITGTEEYEYYSAGLQEVLYADRDPEFTVKDYEDYDIIQSCDEITIRRVVYIPVTEEEAEAGVLDWVYLETEALINRDVNDLAVQEGVIKGEHKAKWRLAFYEGDDGLWRIEAFQTIASWDDIRSEGFNGL